MSSAEGKRSRRKAKRTDESAESSAGEAGASEAVANGASEAVEDTSSESVAAEVSSAEESAEAATEVSAVGETTAAAVTLEDVLGDGATLQAVSEDAAPRDGEGEGAVMASTAAHTPAADLARDEQKKLLESLVFVSSSPIGPQQLGRMLKLRSAHVRELLEELANDYAPHGIQLVELAGGFQFRSAPSSSHYVREVVAQPPVRLTRAQLETLALVAYRQPITRPEIDDVRGVDSGSALRVLLERGLLKMLGRKDEPGRPLLYGTAPYFLEFFSMRSLKDLPTLREFTELSDENRALFKRKTGETIEEAEAALLAQEEAARADLPEGAEPEGTEASSSEYPSADESEPKDPDEARGVEDHDGDADVDAADEDRLDADASIVEP